MVFHAQGDHVFNDWRDAFDTVGDGVFGFTQSRPTADKAVAAFADLKASPLITELRNLTATCPGHVGNADQNSIEFGAAKQDFTNALIFYLVDAYHGETLAKIKFLRGRELEAYFLRLTKASFDQDAANALIAETSQARKAKVSGDIDVGKDFYLSGAPAALRVVLQSL